MTKKILEAILDRMLEIAADNDSAHFSITINTVTGKRYNSWDEEIDLEEDFLQIYNDDGFVFIPYSNIESVTM